MCDTKTRRRDYVIHMLEKKALKLKIFLRGAQKVMKS